MVVHYNNLIVSSAQANRRTNEYDFVLDFQNAIIQPNFISISKCSIPNNMLSFRSNQLSIYIKVNTTITKITMINGYYDDVTEFLTMLNQQTTSALSNDFIWSYSNAYECIKLANTQGVAFSILHPSYSNDSCIKRLGFIAQSDYLSYLELNSMVIYATGVLQLARTSGFFISCSLADGNNSIDPDSNSQIIDFIPIELQNLKYGDSIVGNYTNLSMKKTPITKEQYYNVTTEIRIQIYDDELQPIQDIDKGGNTILFMNLDYD